LIFFVHNRENKFLRALGGHGGGKDLLDPVLALLDVAPLLAPMLLLDLLLCLLGEGRISADGGVGLLVNLGDLGGLDAVLDVLAEEGLVLLGLLLLEGLLVVGNVLTEDALLENLGVKLLALSVVAGEPLLAVGDQETTINGTLFLKKGMGVMSPKRKEKREKRKTRKNEKKKNNNEEMK
jgi:hypothetical protein